jgi:hypothetical protein
MRFLLEARTLLKLGSGFLLSSSKGDKSPPIASRLNPFDSAKDCRFCSGLAKPLPIIDNVKVRNHIKLTRYPIMYSKALFVSE